MTYAADFIPVVYPDIAYLGLLSTTDGSGVVHLDGYDAAGGYVRRLGAVTVPEFADPFGVFGGNSAHPVHPMGGLRFAWTDFEILIPGVPATRKAMLTSVDFDTSAVVQLTDTAFGVADIESSMDNLAYVGLFDRRVITVDDLGREQEFTRLCWIHPKVDVGGNTHTVEYHQASDFDLADVTLRQTLTTANADFRVGALLGSPGRGGIAWGSADAFVLAVDVYGGVDVLRYVMPYDTGASPSSATMAYNQASARADGLGRNLIGPSEIVGVNDLHISVVTEIRDFSALTSGSGGFSDRTPTLSSPLTVHLESRIGTDFVAEFLVYYGTTAVRYNVTGPTYSALETISIANDGPGGRPDHLFYA